MNMALHILADKKFSTIVLALTFCCSCQMEDLFSKKPQKAIIGKWDRIAYGENEDKMTENKYDDNYVQFYQNGTYAIGWYNTGTNAIPHGTYTIDKKNLQINYYHGGYERYKYIFFENKLKIVRDPMVIRPEGGEGQTDLGITNIFIYKLKEKL